MFRISLASNKTKMDKSTAVDGRDRGTIFCRNYYFGVDGRGRVKGYEFNNFNRRGSNIKHKVLLFKHTKRDIKMVTSRVGKKDSLFS